MTKGRLISKCLFCVFNSTKKNERMFSFVFLGELKIHTTKKLAVASCDFNKMKSYLRARGWNDLDTAWNRGGSSVLK